MYQRICNPRTVFGCLASLLAVACGNPGVTTQHVVDPGVYVVTTPGAHSVVWSTSSGQRVCTLGRSEPSEEPRASTVRRRYGGHGAKPLEGEGDATMDAALFRLCEARANGDITQEQYTQALHAVLDDSGTRAVPAHPGLGHARGRHARRGSGCAAFRGSAGTRGSDVFASLAWQRCESASR